MDTFFDILMVKISHALLPHLHKLQFFTLLHMNGKLGSMINISNNISTSVRIYDTTKYNLNNFKLEHNTFISFIWKTSSYLIFIDSIT